MSVAIFRSPTQYAPCDPAVPLSDLTDLDIRDWKKNESRIVWEIQGRFEASYQESRYIRQFDWRRNWEFFSGNQWIYWNAEIPDFAPLPVPDELRYTENRFRGMVVQSVNLMVQGDPAADCMALNNDWDSIESAKMAEAYCFTKARELDLGQLREQNAYDAYLYGFGVRKIYYQPAGGGVDAGYLEGRLNYAGVVTQEARSPWGWFPQVGREGPYIKGMDYCTDTNWVSPAWVERAFPGIKLTDADFEPGSVMPSQLLQPGDLNWALFGMSPNRKAPSGKLLMLDYYQVPAPVPGHEHGLEIHVIGTHVLGKPTGLGNCPDKPPYEATLPYALFSAPPRRGTFYPRPPASDLVEPQMRVNTALSHEFTISSIFSMPNLLTTKGDHTPNTASICGEKWEIPPGIEDPRWLPAPPIPAQLFALKADAIQSMYDVSQNSPTTMGHRSSVDESGKSVEALRDNDQIDLQATVRGMARAEETAFEMMIQLAKKYEKEEKLIQISGRNGKSQAFRFKRDALRPEKVRVVVQATSMLPFLSSSRSRLGMEMAERGLFGPPGQIPPKVARAVVKWADNPGLFGMLPLLDEDEELADRNHSGIIDQGQAVFPPQPPEGANPEAFAKLVEAAEMDGKGFQVDADWDPSPLIEYALTRKKKDDAAYWPPEVRKQFRTYVEALKMLQQMHAQAEQQGQMEQAKAMMGLELEADAVKQENQAKGRAKVKVMGEVAKGMMQPDSEHDQLAAEKAKMATKVLEHALTSEEQSVQHEHELEVAKIAASKPAAKKGK